jgi:hypothetical protein
VPAAASDRMSKAVVLMRWVVVMATISSGLSGSRCAIRSERTMRGAG